jgi:DNA-binding SARP family transcriptional activator
MLGPLEVRVDGRRLGARDFGGRKPKQLLEILLLQRGRMVPKDRIAELLWGDRLPQRAAATIETYVSVLRRRLGAAGLIVTEPGGYRVPAERVEADTDRYEALLREAAVAAPARRRQALEQAVALGEPELLADEPYAPWAVASREHYRERQIQALVELAETCLELDAATAAAEAAEAALALDRTRERAYRAGMRAQVALGDRAAALRLYERCLSALARELGVTPTAETAGMHAAILRDRPHDRGHSRASARLPIAYAHNGATRIAYQVVGDGPLDLVFAPSSVTNLGATWDEPTYAGFLGRLAELGRLILFDKRGTGLSDPALDLPSDHERSEDLRAVLDAAGSRRAVLFGVCAAGALCAHLAAQHPDRVAGLILHNSGPRLVQAEGYPWGWPRELHEQVLAAFDEAWMGDGSALVRRNPGLADDPRYRDWFARYVRLGANPWMARRLTEMNAQIDVRACLGEIRAPCLVVCRTEDPWLSPDNSRYLAERIAGARLLELPGRDHDPWVGDVEPVLAAVREFVTALPRSGRAAARAA